MPGAVLVFALTSAYMSVRVDWRSVTGDDIMVGLLDRADIDQKIDTTFADQRIPEIRTPNSGVALLSTLIPKSDGDADDLEPDKNVFETSGLPSASREMMFEHQKARHDKRLKKLARTQKLSAILTRAQELEKRHAPFCVRCPRVCCEVFF